jgi:hypothetical protein
VNNYDCENTFRWLELQDFDLAPEQREKPGYFSLDKFHKMPVNNLVFLINVTFVGAKKSLEDLQCITFLITSFLFHYRGFLVVLVNLGIFVARSWDL